MKDNGFERWEIKSEIEYARNFICEGYSPRNVRSELEEEFEKSAQHLDHNDMDALGVATIGFVGIGTLAAFMYLMSF